MSVWFAIPSKRPPEEAEPVLKLWRERGYKIALALDGGGDGDWARWPDFASIGVYEGYAQSVNMLCRKILIVDEQAEWIVTGGDDVEPDPNHTAETIAAQCSEMFYTLIETMYPPDKPAWSHIPIPSPGGSGKDAPSWKRWSTFGVMQPTGDRWGEHDIIPGKTGAYIDRVCGSPWMGREFCRRMYQGQGPLFSGYFHMFEDEELQCVAQKLGVLWQRRDLTQHHRHWARQSGHGILNKMPGFLRQVNSREHWHESKALFDARAAAGFPGHEPIP